MMDLIRERMMLTKKASDADMSTWEKVGESLDVVNEPSVTLSKPCTEIIIVGDGFKALQNAQTHLMINDSIRINGLNENLNTSTSNYYMAKLKLCGYGIVAEIRGNGYNLTTFSIQFTAIYNVDIAEITSVKMIANNTNNAFTSGKFEIWGR